MKTLERKFIITRKNGVHTRVAYNLVAMAAEFQSQILLQCGHRQADCSSILDILSMAAGCGACVSIRVQGDDAEEAMDALTDLLDCREEMA